MARAREPLRNEFSWSKSRHEKLAECPRQYFFYYYGSWGGWERDADPAVRELYVLKKLTARAAWAGSTVHDAVARALSLARDGQRIDPERLLDLTRARMRAEFRQSREKAYRVRKAFGLMEHEYDEDVPDEVWKANWEFVETCIRAFLGSRWMSLAADLPPDRWLPIDELGSFSFEGTRIFAAPDFAFRRGDGGAVVIDWKTGQRRESDREQLRGYAMYARDVWDVPLDRIECRVVYLPSLEEDEVHVDDAELAAFADRMRASIAQMRALLDDPAANVASIEKFPRTDDERTCARCVFRRPCRGGSA
jgi:hypothetical protein